MSEMLANDLRAQYKNAFKTIRAITEAFPEDRWRVPHGDIYYIPSRIAYHLAVFIDGVVCGGFDDKEFLSKLPYGNWYDAKAEALPDRTEFLTYFDGILSRAEKVLAVLNDEILASPTEPEKLRFSASKLGLHIMVMRELSAHTGELNKMLIENGKEDIWF
jgi:hypothetical protein